MKRLLIVPCALLCSCAGWFSQDPAPVIVPIPSDQCVAACDVLVNKLAPVGKPIGCDEGKPVQLKDGGIMGCADFCKYQHDNGVDWNNDCIINKAQNCEEIETVCNPYKSKNLAFFMLSSWR